MTSMKAAGTLIALSASAPSTFDAAGYGAVSGLTTVGEVDGINGNLGRLYEIIKRYALARNGAPTKAKANYDDGNFTLPFAVDYSDTGQNLVRTAVASSSEYTFKITLPNGTLIYGQTLVLGAPVTIGDTGSFVMGEASLEIVTSSTGVGLVIV